MLGSNLSKYFLLLDLGKPWKEAQCCGGPGIGEAPTETNPAVPESLWNHEPSFAILFDFSHAFKRSFTSSKGGSGQKNPSKYVVGSPPSLWIKLNTRRAGPTNYPENRFESLEHLKDPQEVESMSFAESELPLAGMEGSFDTKRLLC